MYSFLTILGKDNSLLLNVSNKAINTFALIFWSFLFSDKVLIELFMLCRHWNQ